MTLVIKGRLVPLASDRTISPKPLTAYQGRVWIGDDGTIAAVTRGDKVGPEGFDDAPEVDVGHSLVLPGLIDLHNHLAYNTLPLWTEPTRTTPYPHHNSWPSADSYAESVTWPAYAFITAAPSELLAYVEAKAIVGGTTSIQGSPPKNRPRDGWLVRNIEDETFGEGDANRVYASTLTLKGDELGNRAERMRDGSTFIYHCAEGQPGSIVAREYRAAANAGCLQDRFVAIHCNAVDRTAFASWRDPGTVVWSPFSNLWLYGTTTDVPAARAEGLTVCIGSDWGPSGTKHVLAELKVARIVADHLGWDLSDSDLVEMVTALPGDVLAHAWNRPVGRLQPGALADLVVVAARSSRANPFATLMKATERDIELVIIDGRPRYGTTSLMTAAKAQPRTPIDVAGMKRRISLSRPDEPTAAWAWGTIVDRLEQVRRSPKKEIDKARGRLAAWAGRLDAPGAPLRLALDMPTGKAPIGGLPKDLAKIKVPALDSITHDDDFFTSVSGRGFHGGTLDGLRAFYP